MQTANIYNPLNDVIKANTGGSWIKHPDKNNVKKGQQKNVAPISLFKKLEFVSPLLLVQKGMH